MQLLILLNSKLRLFAGKLKSKCTRPFLITKMIPRPIVQLEYKEGIRFTLNKQRIKTCLRAYEEFS